MFSGHFRAEYSQLEKRHPDLQPSIQQEQIELIKLPKNEFNELYY